MEQVLNIVKHCLHVCDKGYLDWNKNEYFNCTEARADNPSPERCGVPYSCCIHGDNEDSMINLQCGYEVMAAVLDI